jgi:LacI family transcriptional regulator
MVRIEKDSLTKVSSPHVALLVETTLESGRDILRGIADYSTKQGPWSVYHEPRSLFDKPPEWLESWEGDGIIARIQTPQLAEAVVRSGLPCIDVLGAVEGFGIPLVHVDNQSLVIMAADHLLQKGYRRFAYCGMADQNWSRERAQFFESYLEEKGFPLSVYDHTSHRHDVASNWERAQNQLSSWLGELEKPVGILVCSDQIGTDLMEACRRAGIQVPDQAGVMGIDDDEPLCMVCNPPMTSIDASHQAVGYRAAMELDRLMSGSEKRQQPLTVKPARVSDRRSTDALNVGDENIIRALRFIGDFACKGIGVDEVARAAMLSRSVLQRRFKSVVGRTVHEELLRCRVRKAEELLGLSELSLVEIAEIAGFKHQEYMGAVFKSTFGITAAAYRKRNRFDHQ